MMKQNAATEGITEQSNAEEQLKQTWEIISIRTRVEDVVLSVLSYC